MEVEELGGRRNMLVGPSFLTSHGGHQPISSGNFSVVRVALSIALVMMVISELIAADNGLGFYMLRSQRLFQTANVYAGVLTIEFKVNLMSPGRGDWFLFRGEVTKPGSNIIVADGRGYAVSDGPAKLIASMTGTMMVVRGREDVAG